MVLFVLLLVEEEGAFDEVEDEIIEKDENDEIVEGVAHNFCVELESLDDGDDDGNRVDTGDD